MTLNPSPLERRYGLILLAACIVLLFPFLGETLFNTRGSSREAIVAVTMLKDGNWILPINNGVDMPYKPPFMHWIIALVSLPWGKVTELTARIPSALALTAMVMAGYRFFARREGGDKALVMGVVTLTCFEVHRAGVGCRVDMMLAAMMVLALYALFVWTERGLRGVPWLAALALSGAFLTKGPVGAALPCVVTWIYCGTRGLGWGKSLLRLIGVGLLSCVLPIAWYVAAWQQGGDRFLHLIYEENVLRLIGKMSYASHVNPWTYNVMTVVTGFLPYTLAVLFSLFVLPWRRLCRPATVLWRNLTDRLRSMSDARLFSLLSFALIFIFYCIPKSKRSTYLLPLYPFLAYFLAEYLLWLRRRHRRVIQTYGWTLGVVALLLSAAFIVVRMGLVPDTIIGGRHPEEGRAMLAALRNTALGFGGIVSFLAPPVAVLLFIRSTVRGRGLLTATLAIVCAVTFALDGLYQPLVLNVKSDKPVAERIAKLAPEGKIYSFRTDVTPGNPMHPFTINFYLNDRVMPFEAAHPREGWLLVGNDEIDDFRQRYPQWTVREQIDFHHRSCDDRKYVKLYYIKRQ